MWILCPTPGHAWMNYDAADEVIECAILNEHRIRLFITLCKKICSNHNVWVSTQDCDGSTFGDWFVMGINQASGIQITYHLPARFWNEVCEFATVLEKAPEWDGHTPADVIERLKTL